MENLYRIPKKIVALGLLFFFFSCSQDEAINSDLQTNESQSFAAKMSKEKFTVFKGPEVALGYGKVRSWVSVNKDGFPDEIGIEITPEAFKNLTVENEKSVPPEHSTIVVPLHLKAKQSTPFDHVGLNWNPHGHPPPGVFDAPHFDIHFYMISVEEQLAIPAWSSSTDALFKDPLPDFMPADYWTPPGPPGTVEPQMGKHWLPANLENFLPFSKIMIYGSYNGELIFVEPMITLDYLLSNIDSKENDYSQPAKFVKAGNYPTKYNIYHLTNGNTYITLSSFVYRAAGN